MIWWIEKLLQIPIDDYRKPAIQERGGHKGSHEGEGCIVCTINLTIASTDLNEDI
jgi:hypothetical protein